MRETNGFTLVELLVAMLAATLLLLPLSWSVSTLGRQLNDDADLPGKQVEAVAPILTALLEQAQPTINNPDAFTGDASHIAAIVPPPEAAGPIGPLRLDLTVRPGRDGEQTLNAHFEPLRGAAQIPEVFADRVLLSGFRTIEFRYTPASLGLPRLITIALRDMAGRQFELSVAPKLTSDSSCRFDPISLSCRS